MGNIPGAGGTTTSFSNTPQANDDCFYLTEDALNTATSSYSTTTKVLTLDVMANDLGGNAKSLFSIDDSEGRPITDLASTDLLTNSRYSNWERTDDGNWIRIANGKVEFKLADPAHPGDFNFARDIGSLNGGENVCDQFTYAIKLGNGTLSWATVRVNITGINDTATISGDAAGSVVEAGGVANGTAGTPSDSGDLDVTDVDSGQSMFQTPANLNGTYGTFTFNAATGAWTYALANDRPATQALFAGQVVQDTLTVTSLDGTASQTITITVTGSNDAPVITAASDLSGAVSEGDDGAAMSDSGQMVATDVDNGATQTWSISAAAAHGTASIAAGGQWSYTVSDTLAVDALAAGETLVDQFTVLVDDGLGGTDSEVVSVTITGTNDGPDVFEGAGDTAARTLTETNGTLGVDGTLSVTDVDTSDTVSAAVTAVSALGDKAGAVDNAALLAMMTVNPGPIAADAGDHNNLAWSFSSGAEAFDFLAVGESLTLTYTVAVDDGHGGTDQQLVAVTIAGSNDGPVGSASAVLDLGTEDTPYVVSAADLLVGFSDVDGDALSVEGLTANHGVVSDNGDGTFTITPPANYNGAIALSYSVIDGNGGSVAGSQSFTLTAVADLIAQDDAFATDEDVTLSASVAANDSTSSGGSLSYAVVAGPANGSLTLNPDGTFSYVPNANYYGSDSFTYTVTDAAAGESDTRTVSLTINPVNDPAVIGGDTGGSITEDAAPNTVSGNLDATDVDNAADSWTVVSSPTASSGGYGTFTIDAAGQWTYTLNNANPVVDALPAGAPLSDSFTVATIDGTAQVVTIAITGANDQAFISGTKTGDVVEAGGVANAAAGSPNTGGQFTITDPDTGEAGFVGPATHSATYGTFTFDALTGVWTYALDDTRSATQALTAGQIVTDVLAISSIDGTATSQATVTITGANDAAVITGLHDGTVTEATAASPGVPSATGDLQSSDVDGTADAWTVVASTATASGYGSYAINATGQWSYTLNNANTTVDNLNNGGTLNDSFTVTTADGTAQVVNIVINGATDIVVPAPNDLVFTALADAINGNGSPNGSVGQLSVGNAVSGAAYTYSATSLTATTLTGGFAANVSGDFTVSSTGLVTATAVDTDRIYELTVQVSNGAGSYSEAFTIVVGTNAADTMSGGYTTGDDVLFAQGNADIILAGSGNDTIFGQNGNDEIHGGLGNDVIYGAANNDIIYFDTALNAASNVDQLMDFNASATDRIFLDDAVFTALGTGGLRNLSSANLVANAGAVAGDGNDYILFDTATGNLYYDADGSLGGARILFAHIDLAGMSGTLDAADFQIV